MSSTPTREETLFADALAQPPSERGAFLAQACGADAMLLARVAALVAAHESPESLIAPPTITPAAVVSDEKPGDVIGRYKLLQKIGEGGCGVVWMAEQEDPVRRRVALKIIKLGMDTKAVIARFEAERQALAIMEHPNIARVLDGGATESGRPFFVMELVRGVSITRFCDDENLATTERLTLFIQVCHAVQHAHQKGIIHRDLKPSNVLVTITDGAATPKVIDFGIAKATQGRLTDATLFTAFEQFIGTPAYMSPEQAELSGCDIDTRSDIYSLGVLLYELLTGKPPFDPSTLMKAGLDEVRRIIREVEPARPSTRLNTLTAADRTTVARHRRVNPAELSTLLRSDLDWVVMKALEKNRSRRYETASNLATDLQRYLHDEPVFARPPSTAYLLQKLYRRHRVGVGAAAAMLATLAAGLGVSTRQYIKEKAAHERAVMAEHEQILQREAAEAARARAVAAEQEQTRLRRQSEANERKAQREAIQNAQIAQFMKDMLAGVGPRVAAGRDTKLLRDILEQTTTRLATDLRDQPEVESELRATVANVYIELGDFGRASEMLGHTLAVQQRIFGREHIKIAETLRRLGTAASGLGRYEEAERWFREALALQRQRDDANIGVTMRGLADLLHRMGNVREAEAISRSHVELERQRWGGQATQVADALVHLGTLVHRAGRVTDAEVILRDAVAIRRQTQTPDAGLAEALKELGVVLVPAGKLAEAEKLFRESIGIWRNVVGSYHPDFASALSGLGGVLQRQGRLAEAQGVHREVVTLHKKFFGDQHAALIGPLHALGQTLGRSALAENAYREALAIAERGELKSEEAATLGLLVRHFEAESRLNEAEASQRRKLEVVRELHGPNHAEVAADLGRLSRLLRLRGDHEGAAVNDQELMQVRANLSAADRARIAAAEANKGDVLRSQGRYAEAEEVYRAELSRLREVEPGDGMNVVHVLIGITLACNAQGKYAEAELAAREWLGVARKLDTHQAGDGVSAIYNIGYALRRQNRLGEAEAAFRQALELLRRLPNASTVNTMNQLAGILEAQHREGELVTLWREAVDHARADLGEENTVHVRYLGALVGALERVGRFKEAEPLARECLALREKLRTGSRSITDAQSLLARALIGQRKFEDAERLLLSLDEKLRVASGSAVRAERAVVISDLVRLYAEWDRAKTAAEWRSLLHAVTNRPGAPTNLTFETAGEKVPKGWNRIGSKPHSYSMGVDPSHSWKTPVSAFVKSIDPQIDGFGGMAQAFWADDYRGKRVRFSAWIKGDVVTSAQLFFAVYRESRIIAFDNMHDRAVKNTTDWTACSIVLDVAPDAEYINLGVFVHGTGTAWFNDVRVDVVGRDVPLSVGDPASAGAAVP